MRAFRLFTSVLAGVLSVGLSGAAVAQNQELTFEFTIDAQIAGSRPWDGTGVSSAAVDNILPDNFLGNMMDTALQTGLDQTNERIAAPDPYICVISSWMSAGPPNTMYCSPRSSVKPDRVNVSFNLGVSLASDVFGVVLLDSDRCNVTGNINVNGVNCGAQGGVEDEVIGFGIYVSDDVFSRIQSGDAALIRSLQTFETTVTQKVQSTFGTSRGLLSSGQGASVDLSKISTSRCSPSCRFGDSNLTIRNSVDGW